MNRNESALNSALLTPLLDRIIPLSQGMPGAGEAGVGAYVAARLWESGELAATFERGLGLIAEKSADAGAEFAALPDATKDEVLRDVEAADPAFFAALVEQAYTGYYTDPSVLAKLGEETRPPQPSGHKIQQGDLTLLDAVRARGPIYREVPS
jgi:hypothetical protein